MGSIVLLGGFGLWFWQAVLVLEIPLFGGSGKQFQIQVISLLKLQADSNILVSPEADPGDCLPYVLAPPSLSCKSGE